jgi:cytochrome b pre-mRNA-processing protein 3
MPIWPFQPSRAESEAQGLLDAVTAASRRPAFYGETRVPDTLEGRFELMTLHAALALIRLRAEPGAGPLAQTFTDKLFRFFDAGLREAGVGDLTVPKRMRALASAFYGRLEAYGAALGAGDEALLSQAAGRNVLGDEAAPFATNLAAHARALAARQAGAPIASVSSSEAWTLA